MRGDDLPYKEIAEQLSMPIGSLGVREGAVSSTCATYSKSCNSPRSGATG